ncbi:TPA: restriction endonuclease subunit S [Pseudomonas aeruginosa]|uniref:restriction endonuclease subunit S n=1 Tax=Pseudomonas aeruginosa TaxID=287 RepID=UPI000EF69F76|nr:restriction endonuclease subunit S [Pseudomonas aeruginosa]MBP8404533.1 restriction endonuclease subunit S [Pseudomonas aeruginosa]MBP8410388.1 restriction endonuclease subunit S [Pseudomonas aeruginosa]MBP8416315.1 restriction endonuclease subunit S [Pseudomonas aeruginosa]MBS8139735.1 restriction endonuclease subunit S [Pseudomonas aeruginosa]MBS8145554.1 restriction endonuclease subunit S [Pseudomonas aeruginosa]
MSGYDKNPLVPRLRFPEFRDAGEWSAIELGRFSRLVTERVGNTTCTPYTITSGVGLISQEEKLGRTIAGNSLKNYIVLQRNDFAYNKSATKAYPQGFIALYVGDDRAAVPNSIFTCFRVDQSQVVPAFLDKLFSVNLHGRWLRKRISIGARAHGSLQVSDDDLMATPVPLPRGSRSLSEQQKIADCLSSLDELITSGIQKFDAINTFKKGLIQELFPRKGGTLPKRRFPEFRAAAEWEIRTLAELAENLDNRRIPVAEKDRVKGGTPYYGASGVVDYIHGHIFDEELLCISEDGANLLARNTPIAFSISGKSWVNNHAHVLRFESRYVQRIVEDYLNSISLEDYLTGMAQPKLNRAKLDTIPVPIPQDVDEQKAVADYLACLDSMIVAQSRKVDLLRTHKMGLMQQLFPKGNGGV